jgi:hypothetical protein
MPALPVPETFSLRSRRLGAIRKQGRYLSRVSLLKKKMKKNEENKKNEKKKIRSRQSADFVLPRSNFLQMARTGRMQSDRVLLYW